MSRRCHSLLALLLMAVPATALAEDEITLVSVTALAGEPFGVGTARFKFAKPLKYRPDLQNVRLAAKVGRALYPVYTTEDSLLATRSSLTLNEIDVDFLFTWTRGVELALRTVDGREVSFLVVPKTDPPQHAKALERWWKWYAAAVRERVATDAYPPQVDNYLAVMLARRLGFKPPVVTAPWSGSPIIDQTLGLFMGAESIRAAMQRDVFLENTQRHEAADQPLPEAVAPPAVETPVLTEQVQIEPIAAHVPADCFYVRFGSFRNYLWLRERVERWGGNLRDLVAVRGIDYGITQKLQRQLALRETVLSKVLGDTLISDIALIGTDPFLREGPSVGVLFEARNTPLLRQQIDRLRREAADANPDAVEQTLKIAGHEVASLITPDNRVRSFYAIDGDYHLVTTSRTIVERFLAAGQGQNALGDLEEFHYARHLMPAGDSSRAFVYFSDPFFRQIVGPQYRVEMTRRMQALAEIELVHLARLAARAEGRPAETLPDLIEHGFLPKDFPVRPDGSRTLLTDAEVTDSLRGARGAFTPIPDIEVTGVTPSESASYEQFAWMYRGQWEQMDPVAIAISQLGDSENGRERVVLDVHITPYAKRHYGWLTQFLAPPDTQRLAAIDEDLLSVQGRAGGEWVRKPGAVYVGLHDFTPEFSIANGYVSTTPDEQEEINYYFGMIAEFPFLWDPKQAPDEAGYVQHGDHWMPWERRHAGFVTFAQQRDVLEDVTPQLKFVEAERPAQVRLHLADLSGAKAARILHAAGYLQARRASAANARFLHALTEQMNVPTAKALGQAQMIFGGLLVCPMGGDYEVREDESPAGWYSTEWREPSLFTIKSVPQDYRFPVLDWIRGLDIEFSLDETTLTTRIELQLQGEQN